MAAYIAMSIEKAETKNATGRAKYTAYFVTISLYEKYRSDVNSILTVDGFDQCIVA